MPAVITVDSDRPDPAELAPAGEALRAGRLVAFPTETVYGLGARADDADAVRRIFAAKGRPADNPLIVHVRDLADARLLAAEVPPEAAELAEAFWPGPLTLVLDAAAGVPAVVTGGLSTVAVRAPHHAVAQALLAAADVPVAAPSANLSGRPSPTTAHHVVADLGDRIDVVVDAGPCPLGVESTVVDIRTGSPIVLREGSIAREQLAAADDGGEPARSPGTRFRHYAPRCEVVIAPVGEGPARAAALAHAGSRVGMIGASRPPAGVRAVAAAGDAEVLARVLYAGLRDAEDAGLDVLVVEAVEERGVGRAVMDRLRRAAAGTSAGHAANRQL